MGPQIAPTGLAYSPAFLKHEPGPWHPERPERLSAIVDALHASGTWDRLTVWEPQPATDDLLRLVHTEQHIQHIQALDARGGGAIDGDTIASSGSYQAALRAVGATVEAVQQVTDGTLKNAFCLPRPPGHHATPGQAMGFCLFNNVAIAAAWLLHERRAARVAILDYDVHHGNGTQDAFVDNPAVLYLSTHQYPLYPGTGHWRETGAGSVLNIPLPAGSGDDVYAVVREQLIEPAVRRFQPDFILVSLGFDAFWDDPLASLRLSIGGAYTALLRSARNLADELCGGRLVVALEGGYHLQALGQGADAVCRLLLDEDPLADPIGPAPEQLAVPQVTPLLNAIASLHNL